VVELDEQAKATLIFIIFVIIVAVGITAYLQFTPSANEIENKLEKIEAHISEVKTTFPAYEQMFHYNLSENHSVILYLNYTNNAGENIDGHLTMYSYKLDIVNRTIQDRYIYGLDIVTLTLWKGVTNETHSFLFENVVGNGNYVLDVDLTTKYGTIVFEPFYIYAIYA